MGIVSYMYSSEVTDDYGFEDTYELYAIAAWDVALAPTISYYQDMDAVEGAYASLGISHSFAGREGEPRLRRRGQLRLRLQPHRGLCR